MDNELKNLEEEKEQLKKELEEIKEKTRENRKKIRKYKLENNHNIGNTHIRVCNKFYDKIEYINRKREEFGFDALSITKITELFVRHENCIQTENDIIHFNIELEKNKGIVNV